MKKILFCFIVLILILTSSVFSQREVVDKISVVVGSEVILASEIANQLQMYVLQTGQKISSEKELEELQDKIIDQMISDKLFLIAARQDTLVQVRQEEIEQALDEQVANISGNFSSYEEFLNALAAEGLTIRNLKKRYRKEIENQLLKQRFIQSKLYTVSVSKKEVEEFYNEFKDSIPVQPEAIRLAHILFTVKASDFVEDSVKNLAQNLRKRIIDGADFATISSQYSSFGAGVNGGDLGYISKTDVVEEFARAAFNLSVGDISGVIRTQFGYHIIKCEGKKEDKSWLRHVLLGVIPTAEDTLQTKNLADSLLTEIRGGADFAKIAKEYSEDNTSRPQGGELGWVSIRDVPPELVDYVSGWKTPIDYRGPAQTPSGFHILKLLDYTGEKKYDLENDFDKIKQLARQDKTGNMVDKWIAELKEETYIDYRLD
ncbi:MAG: hypothetical protein DRP35_02620 [Candidatus Zixiibacteriota bacterium]|nr:MAG: hypothetical protein DRP35_02620 [candidate division Zixibacteria bacterium]